MEARNWNYGDISKRLTEVRVIEVELWLLCIYVYGTAVKVESAK